jgi:hypothetical protein
VRRPQCQTFIQISKAHICTLLRLQVYELQLIIFFCGFQSRLSAASRSTISDLVVVNSRAWNRENGVRRVSQWSSDHGYFKRLEFYDFPVRQNHELTLFARKKKETHTFCTLHSKFFVRYGTRTFGSKDVVCPRIPWLRSTHPYTGSTARSCWLRRLGELLATYV